MAGHFFRASRRRRGWRSTSRRRAAMPTTSPRRRTRPSAARCGRPCAARASGHAVDEGTAVKVAVCDYRAGNMRSVEIALRRLGAELVDDVAAADLAVLPGRRLGALGDGGASRAQGLDVVLRARVAAGRAGARHLPRPAARARLDARRTAASKGSGILPGRSVRLAAAACRAWAGRSTADGDALTTSRTPTPPRRRARPRGRRESWPRRAPGSFLGCPVPSREERRRGCALPRPGADGGEGAMPLPRLIPCLDVAAGRVVKGVQFQGLRDMGDPVELGAAYSDAAPTSSCSSTSRRRSRGATRWSARRAGSRSSSRSRSRSAAGSARSPTRTRCSRRAPTRSPSTRRRSRSP